MKRQAVKIFIFLFVLFIFNESLGQEVQYDPPWNEPIDAALDFTIEGIDNVPDIYGDVTDPQLVIFFAGNQYMVVDQLLAAFKKAYPQYKRVLAETLPPGILARQMTKGSLSIGNMRLSFRPDIYTAGKGRIEENEELFSRTVPYAKNKLAIMIKKGNPYKIQSLNDLGKAEVRVSMPNPEWEGIARVIEQAYVKAGGEALRKEIMEKKTKTGKTILTKIHHRQTPLNLLYQRSDAGPVWITEALYHQAIHGAEIDFVTLPESQNMEAVYFAGRLKEAPHPEAAGDFLEFMQSDSAKAIYKEFGFEMP